MTKKNNDSWSVFEDGVEDISGLEVEEDSVATSTPVLGVATETTQITDPDSGKYVVSIKKKPLLDKRSGIRQGIDAYGNWFESNVGKDIMLPLASSIAQDTIDTIGLGESLAEYSAKQPLLAEVGYTPRSLSDEALELRKNGQLDVDSMTKPISSGWLSRLWQRAFLNDEEQIDLNKKALAEQNELERIQNEAYQQYNKEAMNEVRKRNGEMYGEKYDMSNPVNRGLLEEKYRKFHQQKADK